MTGQRRALLMGVSSYDETELPSLQAVDQELDELAAVFRDAKIGQFDVVQILRNYSRQEGIGALSNHLQDSGSEDLLLIYISGHVLISTDEDLIICARDSQYPPTPTSGITAHELITRVSDSQVGQILLILDGCYSGNIHALTQEVSGLASSRLVVMTSAGALQMARAGSFSTALAQGLREGRADIDGDGDIKVFEAFEYIRKELGSSEYPQEPALSMFGRGAASIVLAQSTLDEPRQPTTHGLTGLPEQVLADMHSSSAMRREGATWALCSLYCSEDPGERSRAILALHEMAEDDEPMISGLARLRLSGEKVWAERLKAAVQPDWTLAALQIEKLEIHMTHGSGDLNIVTAGRDAKGIAAGRKNRVEYKESLGTDSFKDISDVQEALDLLAAEASESDLPWREKADILSTLAWWQENISSPDGPEQIAENVSKIRTASEWVRGRFLGIMNAIPDAVAAAWIVEALAHIAR